MSYLRHGRAPVGALLLVLLTLSVGVVPVAADTGATVPTGFRDELVWGGLSFPTAVAFTPDGSRAFVAEKSGRIRGFDGLADTTSTLVADLRSEVYDYWDRGLLGLAVDPGFPTRPYLYALYTYDSVPWNDVCPNPPGSTTDGCLAGGRLTRLTVGDDGLGSVIDTDVLISDWCQQFPSHSVGSVGFGPDGALYVSGGDGASFTAARDSGQYGGTQPNTPTPVNPCNDPGSQGGALRSQDIRTSADPTGLGGTVIRVDPNSGAAWPANANAGLADANAERIIGYGLRNPFRFTFDEDGGLWIGDVGYSAWEEINELPDPDAAPRNFGWPCYEGIAQQTSYWNAAANPAYDPALCTSIGAQAAPEFRYQHSGTVVSGDGCGTGSSAIAGLTFLGDDTLYPDDYDGGLFWTDYNRKCIWFAPRGNDDRPDFDDRVRFANLRRTDDPAIGGVATFLGKTPDGDVLYTSFERGEVRAIRFYPPNAPPSADFEVTPDSGVGPLQVQLDASGSSDSNGDVLSYAWDLDNDGQYDDATGVNVTTTLNDPGNVTIRLRVTDDAVPPLSDTASHVVQVGNAPPVITLSTPLSTLTWAVGQQIGFSATATDPQDGVLPASAFHWEWAVAHCRPDECHEHVVETIDDVRNGTFAAPNHPYPSHLRVSVTVTDSDGLSTTVTREVFPKTGTVSATSVPAGVPLGYYLENELVPLPGTGIVGSTFDLEAPPTATFGEGTYAFDHWSDGATAASRSIAVVTGATQLTATYRLTHTTDAPNTCSAAPLERRGSAWRSGKLPTGSDVDWYRFSMAEAGTVRVLLGDLPTGASLALYQGCSTKLASQDRSGTAAEEIVQLLSAGTYAVKVTSIGSGSMTPYALQIARLPGSVSVTSATSHVTGGTTLNVVGEVWNDANAARGPITITAKLLDANGAVLATRTGSTEVQAPGRNRAPFRLSRPLPAGFASVRTTVSSSPAPSPLVTLSTSGLTSTSVGGRWRVTGTVAASSAVHGVRVVMTQYDDRGNVIDVTRATLPAAALAAGGSTSFDAWSTYTGGAPDRVRIAAIGIKD